MEHRPLLRDQRRRIAAGSWGLCTFLAASFLIAATTLTLPISAQVGTASLAIEVLSDEEALLPGVTVEVASPDTGLHRTAVTGETGSVLFPALPTGTYEIRLQLEGMDAPDEDKVTLIVGQRARLRLALRAQVSEAITVTAEVPLVDIYRMDSSTNIVPEQMEQLPVPDRQYERLALLAPGVQRDPETFLQRTGSPILGPSGTSLQTTYMMDSVDFTDPFHGFPRVRVSQDAVSEFRVIGQRFDTEIGGSAGGAISIVTKSGTNRLSGSAFGFFRANELREKGALELEEVDYSRYHLGFTVGGPIHPDRNHFFVSVEHMDEANLALFRPTGAFQDLARDVPHPRAQTMALLSLDHRFGDSNSGIAKLTYERYREDNYLVGGPSAESHGIGYDRDNWNLLLGHSWVLDDRRLNDLRLQVGRSAADWPSNSEATQEWFSWGNSLQIGQYLFGESGHEASYLELRDTFSWILGQQHNLKSGISYQHQRHNYLEQRFQSGPLVYMTDDRSLPAYYLSGEGSSKVRLDADVVALFVQDDWSLRENLVVSLGLRYDADIGGNNPDFEHPLVSSERGVDWDNLQPRLGFNWDISRNGRNVLRGGIGQFNGRYVTHATLGELQFNGVTGRTLRTRLNGKLYGLPPSFWLDPEDPENTGLPLPPDIFILADKLVAPESIQATLGYSRRLGNTGLVFDSEVIYVEGKSEILTRDMNYGGRENPARLDPDYNWIIRYTNDGRSRYQALVLGLNGTLRGGHLITSSVTFADKRSIKDDPLVWVPVSESTDPEADWGRANTSEQYHLVLSGVFRLPWTLTLAPIYEYGSGNPWTRMLGYDYNLDGFNNDRLEGVERNDADGRSFRQLSLRLTKTVRLGDSDSLDLILEAFNVFNTTNYAVTSIDNSMFLSGPTLADPSAPYIRNPRFGEYTATHAPREIQLGLRYRF